MSDPASGSDGKRFSHNYLYRGEPEADSPRVRTRLAALLDAFDSALKGMQDIVLREHGVRVPGMYGPNWHEFLRDADLRDVLDLVTTAFERIYRDDSETGHDHASGWVEAVRRIFREENVRYRIDDIGGVHFAVDDEFEQNTAATIKALEGPRYSATLTNFNDALEALSGTPPATKDAIRAVFSANEGLFRLMFPKAPRLTADEVDKNLLPLIQKLFSGDPTLTGAVSKLLRSFKEWIEAAHFYRHEPGHAEPKEPPLDIAVLLVGAGATWVRWLAELDRQMGSGTA